MINWLNIKNILTMHRINIYKMEEEINIFDFPETIPYEILDKIEALAWKIYGDYTEPTGEANEIAHQRQRTHYSFPA